MVIVRSEPTEKRQPGWRLY